jgi:hypothetical protein
MAVDGFRVSWLLPVSHFGLWIRRDLIFANHPSGLRVSREKWDAVLIEELYGLDSRSKLRMFPDFRSRSSAQRKCSSILCAMLPAHESIRTAGLRSGAGKGPILLNIKSLLLDRHVKDR